MNCHGEGNEEDLLRIYKRRKLKILFSLVIFVVGNFIKKVIYFYRKKIKIGGML